MLPKTAERVSDQTAEDVNQAIRRATAESVARVSAGGPEAIAGGSRSSTGSGTSSGRSRRTPPPSRRSGRALPSSSTGGSRWSRSWSGASSSSTPSRAGARRSRCSGGWASGRSRRSRRSGTPRRPSRRLPGRLRRRAGADRALRRSPLSNRKPERQGDGPTRGRKRPVSSPDDLRGRIFAGGSDCCRFPEDFGKRDSKRSAWWGRLSGGRCAENTPPAKFCECRWRCRMNWDRRFLSRPRLDSSSSG